MPLHTLKDIARELDGTLIGDGSFTVNRLVHPKDAKGPGDLLLAFDKNLHEFLEKTPAKAAVMAVDQQEIASKFSAAVLVTRPRAAMARLTQLFATSITDHQGIHPTAILHANAKIGKNVSIGAFCTVEDGAVIGDNTRLISHISIGKNAIIGKDGFLHAGVRVEHDVFIGDRAMIHPNAVIGADGFSFVTPEQGSVENIKESGSGNVEAFNTTINRIHSLGSVILGDDVEVGACTTIDRGTITNTVIGRHTKIDNQVQIGHNVTIGENCMICGHAGIAGSVTIGNRVILGGKAGVADHVKIGDDAVLGAAATAGNNLAAKGVYMGFPAMPRDRFREQFLYISRLKAMNRRIKALEELQNTNVLEPEEKKG